MDNKKKLNSILQLVFLFQISIINILIELVFIYSPEMLDTADCKKWQQCGNVQFGLGNFYKMGEETLELAKNVDGCLAPEISTSVKPVYITIRQ